MMYIYLAIALVSAALSGVGAWRVQDWRYGAKEAQRLEQAREDRARKEKTIDTAAVGHEKDKVRIKREFVTITQEIERVVKEPFYIAVDAPACFDDSGLRQLQAAIAGPASPASQPKGAMPRPDKPG